MKFYYKLSTRTESGKRLRKFNSQAILALRRADAYAKRMGAIAYHSSNDAFAGGVEFLVFDKEPNLAIWRAATKVDGEVLYEPNVKIDTGVKMVNKNQLPTDEPDCIYNRNKLLSWSDVKPHYSLATWAKTANIYRATTMSETELWTEVNKRMKDRNFISYIRFSDMPSPDLLKKAPRRSTEKKPTVRLVRPSVKVASRAVTAEQQRMALPVMSFSSLMDILTAGATDETSKCNTTPIFFEWEKVWYIGVDVPCDGNPDMELIDANAFTFALNTKKRVLAREAAEFDEFCKEEKAEAERNKALKAEVRKLKR